MKYVLLCITVTFISYFLFMMVSPCHAENQRFKQVLELSEKTDNLSLEEVKVIKPTKSQELERLIKSEYEIESEKRTLLQPEEELKKKNEDLQKTTVALDKADHAVHSSAEVVATDTDANGAPEQTESTQGIHEPSETLLAVEYQNGLCFSTQDPDTFSLCIGSLLQTDYRYYHYSDANPNNNKFDVRRARLLLSGRVLQHFNYKFQYEFQGTQSRNLLDAYVDLLVLPFASFRIVKIWPGFTPPC